MRVLFVRTPRNGTSALFDMFERQGLKTLSLGDLYPLEMHDPQCPYYSDPYNTTKVVLNAYERNWDQIEEADIVYGHVPGPVFKSPPYLFKDVPWVTFIRDPVQFVVSGWHFARTIGHIPWDMSLAKYCMMEYRQNWQYRYIQNVDWYEYIITHNTYNADMTRVCEIAGAQTWYPKVLNDNNRRYENYLEILRLLETDESSRYMITATNNRDCAMYYDVQRRKELGLYL